MGCGQTRCRECPTKLPACQLINGLCHACHAKLVEASRPKKDANTKTK